MGIDDSLSRRNFWAVTINSTAAFVLSYLFIFYLNLFTIVFTAGMFDFDISFDYNHIVYHVKQTDWTHDSVKVMFGSGPLLTFIVGLLALVAYSSLSEEITKFKLFLLWITLHAFNYVFTGIIIGIIFKIRIAHLFIWMYFNDSQLLMMAITGLFGIILTAILLSRKMAFSANIYFNKLDENNFPFFIMAQFIVPFLLGGTWVVLYFIPEIRITEIYIWTGLAVILLISSLRMAHFDPIYFDEEPRKIDIFWGALIAAVLFSLLMRLLCQHKILINWSV